MKTGMLSTAPVVRVVADTLRAFYATSSLPPFILDPVCVSTSGHTLLDEDAIHVLDLELAPLATLITPNRAEAETLLGRRGNEIKIENIGDMIHAAQLLVETGCPAVLLKGGHIATDADSVRKVLQTRPSIRLFREGGIRTENMEILANVESHDVAQRLVVDVLARRGDEDVVLFVRPQIDSLSTHGTGCTLSAAIASHLALEHDRT
jgi:hydroxymethylpyrimidine/phosphomethylpyrimidine kinase / thiaminase